MAYRHPAHMRLLLRVALHMPLEVLLALEPALAARLLAFELNLLDDRRQVVQGKAVLRRLLA